MKIARPFVSLSALPALALGVLLLTQVGCPSETNNASTTTANADSDADTPQEKTAERKSGNGEASVASRPVPKTDVLNMAYPQDPDKLNPVLANDTVSSAFMGLVCESLATRRFDKPSEWKPLLAESWKFDEEKLEYTINLRKGVYWHPVKLPSGKELPAEEFTSRDVKFTFDCILNEHTEAGSIRSYYMTPGEEDPINIVVTPVNKYVVKIRWKRPYFQMEDYTFLSPEKPIIPRHVYSVDENGKLISLDFLSKEFGEAFNDHWANDMLIGTGPYRFVEWRRNEELSLVRNEKYWGQKGYFSEIYYQCISNPETSVQKALNGELDLAGMSEYDRFVKLRDEPGEYDPKVVRPVDFERAAYRYMGYNLTRPLFQDRQVRVALTHAVPIDQLIESVWEGLAVRMDGPFLPGTPYAAKVTPFPYDLEEAKRLLAEAGWKDTDKDGILDKEIDGQRVKFEFKTMIFESSPMYMKLALMIQENFRRIGVKMDPIPTQWQTMLENLNKKNFDAAILGWALDYKTDPAQIFHSADAFKPDTSNYGYVNKEVDALIEKLRTTLKDEDQYPIYQEIHRLIYADQPYVFLAKDNALGLINVRIENFEPYPELRPYYDRLEWTSSTARLKR
jgi:ABC-type transport system substrate-binding protein